MYVGISINFDTYNLYYPKVQNNGAEYNKCVSTLNRKIFLSVFLLLVTNCSSEAHVSKNQQIWNWKKRGF